MRSSRAILLALCFLPSAAWATLGLDATANPSGAIIRATEQNQSTSGTTIVTPSFSTGGSNRLLVAMLVTDSSSVPFPATLSGGGLAWTKQGNSIDNSGATNESGVAFYTAPAASTLSSVTVTATFANAATALNARVAGLYLWAVFDSNGAMPGIGNNGGINNGASGTLNATVNVGTIGSWLFVICLQTVGNSTVLTADANTTADVNFTATAFGDTWLIGRYKNNPTTATGNQTIGSSATDTSNYTIAQEITPGVPAGGTAHHRPLLGVGT